MAKDDADKPLSTKPAAHHWWHKFLGFENNAAEKRRDDDQENSREIIELELPAGEGVLEQDEREMIHGVVEMGETAVKEIMVPRVEIVGIEIGTPSSEIIEIIKKTGHSRFPLYEDSLDEIRGILYSKDFLLHVLGGASVDPLKIARKAYFIPENKKVDELLRELKKKRLHIAIVVDEYGGTAGLVTMEDILEEIVGEIEDEYDGEPPSIAKQGEGIYLVGGSVTIADLNDETGLSLPEEEFETVGGLIYDLVGSLPEKGRSVDYHDVTFIVEQVEGQRIVKVKLLTQKKAPDNRHQ
ncbi:MAG TPA: magnesium/cobalt efflux protein [candidate division Zixibacteria bacterium]|nr:magnesium/cobalt efflux protein [candidate division Zixibacteria bacterium]HBY99729.1 magnesium/cobalt efflux protein [candidate division Zixibacteria bacterium]